MFGFLFCVLVLVFVLSPDLAAYKPGTIGGHCDHHPRSIFVKRKLTELCGTVRERQMTKSMYQIQHALILDLSVRKVNKFPFPSSVFEFYISFATLKKKKLH